MAQQFHRILIEQTLIERGEVLGEHSMTILLKETDGSRSAASGLWRPTAQTYTDKVIDIAHASSDGRDRQWIWNYGGQLVVGVRSTSPSSHRLGDDFSLFVALVLWGVRRDAGGRFAVTGVLSKGAGVLMHSHRPHFLQGQVLWSPYDYDAWADMNRFERW